MIVLTWFRPLKNAVTIRAVDDSVAYIRGSTVHLENLNLCSGDDNFGCQKIDHYVGKPPSSWPEIGPGGVMCKF